MERHMKIHLSILVISPMAFAGVAEAHPENHALSAINSLVHLLTEPDHLAMLIAAIAVCFGIYRLRRFFA